MGTYGKPNLAIPRVALTTQAAPPISALICFMPEPGLRLIPPVSNVIPLPTKTSGDESWVGAPV